jgi:hypothetical protein
VDETEVNERKMVRRKIAVALGIICIILIIGIGGVVTYYTAALDDLTKSKDTLYNNYVFSHSYSNDEYASLDASNGTYYNLANYFNSVIQLEKSEYVYTLNEGMPLPMNFSTSPNIGEIELDGETQFGKYAGIATVQVSSTSNDTYVNVTYSAVHSGFVYSSQTDIGMNGTIDFPVLPANVVNIRIATHDINIQAIANVTIIYVY